MGELLKEMPKHKGRPKALHDEGLSEVKTIKEIGVFEIDSHRCHSIASIPDSDFEGYIAEARTENGELTTATLQ